MTPPAGWKRVLLSQVATVQTGLSKSQNRKGPSVLRPYLRVANVQDGFLNLKAVKEIEVPVAQLERFSLRAGDVLLTEGGDLDKLGRGALWNGEIDGCVHQNHVFAVRVNDCEELLPEYLACEIQSSRAKSYFLSAAKQTTNLASINSSQLKALPIFVPPVVEQRAIVEVLLTWDAAIEKTEALVTANERTKAGLMQAMFRPHMGKPRKVSDFTRRVTRKNVGGNGHPLTISSVEGLVSQSRYFDKRIAAEKTEHYTLLKRGEFAYNRSYSAGYPLGAIKRLDEYEEGIVSTLYLCFALHGDDAPLSNYFIYFCESGGFNHQIYQVAQEGARNHGLLNVTADDFFRMSMPVPPRDVQERVVKAMDAASHEIKLLRQQAEALRKQKCGLMQKLLTGKWCAKVDQASIPCSASLKGSE